MARGDYRYPDGSVYVGAPTPFINEVSTVGAPVASPGARVQYDLPKGDPNDMMHQPAFTIYPPMPQRQVGVNWNGLVDFENLGPPRFDLPTFFRPANRAMATNTGDQGGTIESKYVLVVPPAKYNVQFRTPFRANNVKDRGNYGGVRSRVPGLSMGG